MNIEYRLIVYDGPTTWVRKVESTSFETLQVTRVVNGLGVLRAIYRMDDPILSYLSHRLPLRLERRDTAVSLDWYKYFDCLYLFPRYFYKDRIQYVEFQAVDINWLLLTRVIAWPAGTTDRSQFINAKAETIMKTLVNYNLGSSATTANGRLRIGTQHPETIVTNTDLARGNNLDWYCMGDNLLTSLQELAQVGGGDFQVYLDSTPSNFKFEFYLGQLGSDRRSTLTFSLENGNLTNPELGFNRILEKTSAIAGGRGVEENRTFVIATGPDYATSNDIEIFVQATSSNSTDGYTDQANAKLEKARAREIFKFALVNTQNTRLDVHYGLGDLVSVQNPFLGSTLDQKIVAITVVLPKGRKEEIHLETETYG